MAPNSSTVEVPSSLGGSDPADSLPRGPHKLSAAEVSSSQRERILAAVIEAVAEKGYVHTSVADILKRAGVSRLTFYQQFSDKEDCFVRAFESRSGLLAHVLEAVGAEVGPASEGTPLGQIDRVLDTYLAVLQAEPASAKALLIDVYAAGPRALEQRNRSQAQFVEVVARALEGSGGVLTAPEDRELAAQVLVGAVSSMVTALVGAGATEQLRGLRSPLIALLEKLLP
jgi:AcrR family transcriptional regulator